MKITPLPYRGMAAASGLLLTALSSQAAIIAAWETDTVNTSTTGSAPTHILAATTTDANASGELSKSAIYGTAKTTSTGYGMNNPVAPGRAGSQGQAFLKSAYYEFSVEAADGYKMTLDTLTLNFQSDVSRSPFEKANGTLRSNITGFGENAPSIDLGTTGGPASDLFPSSIALGSDFQNITQVTFRLYTWDGPAPVGGTFFAGAGNDIEIQGSIMAIPEISASLPLGVLLGSSILGFRRRKK